MLSIALALSMSAVTITNDQGGRLFDYAVRAKQMQSVKFDGQCNSACTVFMALPKVCITPRASFGFHAPYGAGAAGDAAAKIFLMKQYPGWVRSFIAAHGGLTHEKIIMSYSYAKKHMKLCQ